MNGDAAMDLAGKAAPQGDWKRIIWNHTHPGHKPGRNCDNLQDLERKGLKNPKSHQATENQSSRLICAFLRISESRSTLIFSPCGFGMMANVIPLFMC